MNRYYKSPLNYIGGKYKLLPKILPLFPKKINIMYDLFSGGCDVSANVLAKKIFANDINYFVVDIFKTFQSMTIEELLVEIDKVINEWGLSKENKEGYLALRTHYNSTPENQRNPIELYALVSHSFNYQFRFNSKKEFNNPFGQNRSSFNPKMRENLIAFHERLKDIHFSSLNFRDVDLGFLTKGDFVYVDPPYLITTGSYNDGKRGFEGWSKIDDIALFSLLDELNSRKVKFALSNVVEHKGIVNEDLINWSKQYTIHEIAMNYDNCNYQSRNGAFKTTEVLVVNY